MNNGIVNSNPAAWDFWGALSLVILCRAFFCFYGPYPCDHGIPILRKGRLIFNIFEHEIES